MLAARSILAPLFGLSTPLLLDIVAVGFLVYAAVVALAARQEPINRQTLVAFAIADGLWVATSALLLLFAWAEVTPFARALVTIVAPVTEAFAVLQYRGAGTVRGRAPKMA